MFQVILIKYDQRRGVTEYREHSAFVYSTREAAIRAGISRADRLGFDPSKLAILTPKGKPEGMLLTAFQSLRNSQPTVKGKASA